MKIISFTAAAMVLGLERRVVLGDAYAGPNGEPKQDLTIEGLNADDARAILAALDQPDVPAAAPVKEIAKAAPKPTPAPESPKRSEPALTAAPPETRRRRAAAPVPPTPPPPEEEEEEEEEELAPPPIPDALKGEKVTMKQFVVHLRSVGYTTPESMLTALQTMRPQCPALARLPDGEGPGTLKTRLTQTLAVMG